MRKRVALALVLGALMVAFAAGAAVAQQNTPTYPLLGKLVPACDGCGIAGTGVSIDASGFDGNLATTDNTAQKVAQKVDDLTTGGGSGTVHTDTTLTGDGASATPLKVANPFTPAEKTKLTGVQDGAQKNPAHVVTFRTLDNDGAIDGTTYFIKADNTEWNSGSTSDIAAIEIDRLQFSLAQNPQTGTPVDTSWHSLPQDVVDNRGTTLWSFYNMGAGTNVPAEPTFTLYSHNIVKNSDGNYVLGNLVVEKGWTWSGSNGVNWQVVGQFAPPAGAKGIFGVIPKPNLPDDVVYKGELAGSETDRYASYNNAFIGSGYRSGDWVLSSDTNGPPTTPNLIGQPDIATGSGVVSLGRLRTDADPNHLVWAPVPAASDYSSGDVLYASLDRDKGSYLTITLTSATTLVGTGDAAYLWATASWIETGNIANVATAGDYFKLAREVPSDLQIEIPYTDVLGPPWLLVDGSNVTAETKAAIQGDNEEVTLTPDFRVDVTNVDYYVQVTVASKQISIRAPISQANTRYDVDLQRLLQPAAWVKIGDWEVDITTNATRSAIGTSLTFAFNYGNTLSGTQPTGTGTVKVTVIGEDVHRGELARASFEDETPSIAGKGGTAGQVWTRGNSNTNATWSTLDQADDYVFFADDAAVGGTANVITITASPSADAYREGMHVVFEPTANVSGSATINVDSLGAKTIVREDGTTLQSGDILNDRFAHVVYDGFFFVLLNRHVPAYTGPAVYSGNQTSTTWTTVVAVTDSQVLDISAVVRRTPTSDWYTGAFSIVASNLGTTSVWTHRITDQGARLEWRKSSGNLQVRTQGLVDSGFYVVTVRD